MSAQWCLTAWNEPIGLPNCVRSFAYSVAAFQRLLGRAGRVARGGDHTDREHPIEEIRGARAGLAEHALVGDHHVVEGHREQPSGLVDGRRAIDSHPRCGCVHRERGHDAVGVARRDDEDVGDVGVEHERRCPVEPHTGSGRLPVSS